MDRIKFAWIIQIAFSGLSLFVLYKTGNWFGLDTYITFGNYVLGLYFMNTIADALYVSIEEK